jgi:hypothetical protein
MAKGRILNTVLLTEIVSYARSGSRDSSVTMVTALPAKRLRNRGSVPGMDRDFFLLYTIQSGPGAHPAFHLMGIGGPFPRGKAAGS